MTNQLIVPLRAQDRNGEPQAAAKAYIYQSGTMTAVTVTDAAGVPLPWPVAADIDGVFPQMFYAGAFVLKAIFTDSSGAVLPGGTLDPLAIVTNVSTASAISFMPTANVPELTVQAAVARIGDDNADNQTDIATINSTTFSVYGVVIVSGTIGSGILISCPPASNAEGIAGLIDNKAMTPQSTMAAILNAPLTTSQILAATAGLTAGAVGSYGFMQSGTLTYNPGDTFAGSSLTWASTGSGGFDTGASPSGTWRALAVKTGAGARAGLFVRIA